MNYAVPKVEFSPDPLSDATPTYVDVTRFCISADWSDGKNRDLDDPQAGTATIILKNDLRRFEPEYAAGAYYPNIVPLRRFRLTITTSDGSFQQGVFYATSWQPEFLSGTTYSQVTVACVDGFGLLSLEQLGPLDPSSAQNLADVILYDQPFALYLLDDQNSTKMAAAAGPEGVYLNKPILGAPHIAVGDTGSSVTFDTPLQAGRAALGAQTQFSDGNAFTMECLVAADTDPGGRLFVAGPWASGTSEHCMAIYSDRAVLQIIAGSLGAAFTASIPIAPAWPGSHHIAATWDGTRFRAFVDGAEYSSTSLSGGQMRTGDDGGRLYVGGNALVSLGTVDMRISHAAFFERDIGTERLRAHADAAFSRGYDEQLAGDRIDSIVASPLWSTAGVLSGVFPVQPRMQVGQTKLEEIVATVKAEEPWGLFYFDGSGNPQYQGWDEGSSTPAATLGDASGEVPYTDIGLVYDDELYNDVTVSRDGGTTQTVDDTTSQGSYKTRSLSEDGLLMQDDEDALNVANEILSRFKDPRFRVETVTLNGANRASRIQILTRQIGDVVRIRRRGSGGTPIDIITMILGRQLSIDAHGNLTCTWNLNRGFNAADGFWHLGVTGFSELGNTTVLA